MKIIGESNDTYIVEVDKNEMANILGLFSKYNYNRDVKEPKPGDEINIKELYKRTELLFAVKSRVNGLDCLIDSLSTIAKKLKPFKEVDEVVEK